jgi:hypothetical protein
MDEYIKREDALDAVLFALSGTGYQSTAILAIRDIPTADVVEVKHARWIGRKVRDYYTCSNCCAVTKSKDDEYCRHCGARMGGKPKKDGE